MPTIAAIATAPGQGGISIVRLSGPGSKTFLSRVFLPKSPHFVNFKPWTLHRGVLLDENDEVLDDVLAVYMPGPSTYTGEEMAEIHCHGGTFMAEAVMESLLRLGARPADPGEFTKRAYLNGRMDLSQAEAVAELIASPSREAARLSLNRLEGRLGEQVKKLAETVDELRAYARIGVDFPDEEVEEMPRSVFSARVQALISSIKELLKGAERARLVANGAVIVLAGPVNAGKSSLFNALAGMDRALVTDRPGTTRDYLEQPISLDGLPVRIVDTAGLRESADLIENMGIARSKDLLARADLVIVVVDGATRADWKEYQEIIDELSRADTPHIFVWNKSDLSGQLPEWLQKQKVCKVSAVSGSNIDGLCNLLKDTLLADKGESANGVSPNLRQKMSLEKAMLELETLSSDIEGGQPYDCCMTCLDTAAEALQEIIGVTPENELLNMIFSSFCIGK